MNLKDFNLSKEDSIYLGITFLFAVCTILKLIEFHMSGGIFFPDKALYLVTSLKYAGLDNYNIVNPDDLYYSPIIMYLTSLIFRLGIVDQLAILIVTAIFGFFSYFGIYIYLKNRFNPLLSLTGVIIFGSLSEILFNLASGLIDLPSVAVSIWVIIFAIVAIDKNSKYFLIVFPLFVIGFFIRYTVGFVLPIIFLYYLIKRDFVGNIDLFLFDKKEVIFKLNNFIKSDEFKYLFISISLSCIIFILICKFLIIDYGGSLTFFEQSSNTINGNNIGLIYNLSYDKLYYVKYFSRMLFHEARSLDTVQNIILYLILGLGVFISFIKFFYNNSVGNIPKDIFKTDYFYRLLIIISVMSLIVSFVSFKFLNNHLVANISILIVLISSFSLMKCFQIDEDFLSLNILNIAYLLVYLIFISLYPIKVTRYALPLIPPFIYFVVLGLENILIFIQDKFCGDKCKLTKIIPIFLIVFFLISTFSFIGPMEIEKNPVDSIDYFINYNGAPNDLVNVSEYIINHDANYHSKTFASYYHHHRMIKWYLKEDVDFVDDDYHLIDDSDVDYVIINDKVNFNNYHVIYHSGDFYVYYHN